MPVDRKGPEYVPIPTKQEHRTHPGRTAETDAERRIRYDAQEIAREHGISFSQALEIAQIQADKDEKDRRERQSRKEKERQLKRERRHENAKRDTTPVVKTNGPPMPGGAPGLGKRR